MIILAKDAAKISISNSEVKPPMPPSNETVERYLGIVNKRIEEACKQGKFVVEDVYNFLATEGKPNLQDMDNFTEILKESGYALHLIVEFGDGRINRYTNLVWEENSEGDMK